MEVLEERLRARGTESEESLAKVKIQIDRKTNRERHIQRQIDRERASGERERGGGGRKKKRFNEDS